MSLLTASELSATNRRNQEQALPVRGVKEFEPSHTWLENKQISSALYERKGILQSERVEKWSARACANWVPEKSMAEVTRKVGKHWQSFGHEKGGQLFLLPEEALYLLESNLMELIYEDVAMSVQQAYAHIIGPNCPLSDYQTYSKLLRCGFIVMRHKTASVIKENAPSLKRSRETGTQHEPPSKRRNSNGVTSKPDSNIEVIDLEDEESRKFPFIPNMIGKNVVSIQVAPENLMPPNIKPSCKEYNIQLKNLNEPGVGSRPQLALQPYTPTNQQGVPNYFQRSASSVRPSPGVFYYYQQIQRTYYMNPGNYRHQRPNLFANIQYQQYVRPMNFRPTVPLNFPFMPRLNTNNLFPQYIPNRPNIFANLRRPFMNQNAPFPPPPPLLRYPSNSRTHANNSESSTKREECLTPPPNPIVPRLRAKSWAEVKAKLSNSVEIITLDDDKEEGDVESTDINQPFIQPEDCSSLGTILKKLQIFKKPSRTDSPESSSTMIKFDVFHPNVLFRKTDPGTPAYHIAIVSHNDPVPSKCPSGVKDVPVLFAVVQPDTINFFSLCDVELPTIGA